MKKITLLSTIILFAISSCTSALVQATPTLTPSSTTTNTPTVTPFPTSTPTPTATTEPIYAMFPVQCDVPILFYAGFDTNQDDLNIIDFDYVLPEALDALLTYEGYNYHQGYDYLVPEGTLLYPVFNETGTVSDIWTKNPEHGYMIEIIYRNSPATQIADVMDVRVSVGDKVNRDTPLGISRDISDHVRLIEMFNKYGMHHHVHVSFRESPYGGAKVQIPKEYGSPAELPCK